MARKIRREPRVCSRQPRSSPYQKENQKRTSPLSTSLLSERKDWKRATCPVCLEFPHNAVLLLCSSHDKGCRPYICGTSFRFSNCLEQFQKTYTEKMAYPYELSVDNLAPGWPAWKKSVAMDLKCPLCRGQVKGWTIVEPARAYLNKKKRACAQDNCSFIGRYKQLRKHVRAIHRSAKPRSIDPVLENKWKVLENQREQEDVFSTIRSAMPNSVVWGDYVIDFNHSDYDSDFFDDFDDLHSDDLYSDDSDVFERRSTRNIRIRGRVHNRPHGSRHRVGRHSHHLSGVTRRTSHSAARVWLTNPPQLSIGVDRHAVAYSRRSSAEVDSDGFPFDDYY